MGSDGGEEIVVTTEADNRQTSPSEIIERTKAWGEIAKAFMYVEVSSLVLMFSCIGSYQDTGLYAYAVSVSVVSLAACLIIQTGEYLRPGVLERFEKPVSLFLFVWWAVGAGVITFRGPFIVVANGYCSAWAGLFFTTHWALNLDTSKFDELDWGRKVLLGFMAAAAVEMFACINPLRSSYYVGQAAWGLTAGILTILICGALFKFFDEIQAQLAKVTAGLLFVIWATVAGVCTFDGPFLLAGNGFFGAWGGFLASTFFLQHVVAREDEIV